MQAKFKAMFYLSQRYPRSPGYLREAAEALLALKEAGEDWLAIAEANGVKRSRAYELVVLANQNKTPEQMRAEAAARKRKYRENKWLPTKPPSQKGPKGEKSSGTM